MAQVRSETTSQIGGDRLRESVESSGGGAAVDQYEFGTMTSIGSTAAYKVFARAFASQPSVVLTPQRSSGTPVAMLFGTVRAGSFRARVRLLGAAAGAGSANVHYLAFGPR